MATSVSRLHRVFVRWEPYVGLLVASGFFSWLGKKLKVFGELGWPEAIFIGVGSATLLALGLAAILAGWRVFKPIPRVLEETAPPVSIDTDSSATLKAEIAGLERRLTGALDGFKEGAAAQRETDRSNVAALGERINELGELNNRNHDYARRQIASLYDALNAIYQRERLEELSRLIEAGAEELRGPTEREEDLNDTWDDWETKQRAWRTVLEEWCGLANCYSNGLSARILTVSEEELHQDGKAGLSQFPSIGALMIYRGFNIRYFKWRNWREEGQSAVRKVAIQGTAQSRPIYQEGTYAGDRDEHSRGSILRRIVEGNG